MNLQLNPLDLCICKDGVNFDVSPQIALVIPIFAGGYRVAGDHPLVITSAKDGTHSQNSRHHWKDDDQRPSDALDFRTRFFPRDFNKVKFFHKQVNLCNRIDDAYYYVGFIHRTHFHIEVNPSGTPPNIRGWRPTQSLYGLGVG